LLIGKDDDPRALPSLRVSLTDKDASVRAAAVHALAVRDDPTLARDLIPVMEDEAVPVQVRAAAGYLRLTLMPPPPPPSSPATPTQASSKPDARRSTRGRRAH
jgi:HEAT repeat protein